VNEVYLFHGTSREIAQIIIDKGFDTRQASEIVTNKPNGAMFGTAVYFAENSSKSNQYVACPICQGNAIGKLKSTCDHTAAEVEQAGDYSMIIARVLLGDSHICLDYDESKYKHQIVAPLKDGKNEPYDSIFAESSKNFPQMKSLKFREFVIYNPQQVYPEFLVTYSRHSSPPPHQ